METFDNWTYNDLPHTRGDEPFISTGMTDVIDHLPHTRGDEPLSACIFPSIPQICPTRVGMNR